MPARLTKEKYSKVLKLANKAHKVLGCRGVTRSDFKFSKNKFYLLEINTQPDDKSFISTRNSNFKGINFPDLIEKILLDAGTNK